VEGIYVEREGRRGVCGKRVGVMEGGGEGMEEEGGLEYL